MRSAKVMQEITVVLKKKKKKMEAHKLLLLSGIVHVSISDQVFSPVCLPIIQPLNGPVGFSSHGEKRKADPQGRNVPGVRKPLTKSLISQCLFS